MTAISYESLQLLYFSPDNYVFFIFPIAVRRNIRDLDIKKNTFWLEACRPIITQVSRGACTRVMNYICADLKHAQTVVSTDCFDLEHPRVRIFKLTVHSSRCLSEMVNEKITYGHRVSFSEAAAVLVAVVVCLI